MDKQIIPSQKNTLATPTSASNTVTQALYQTVTSVLKNALRFLEAAPSNLPKTSLEMASSTQEIISTLGSVDNSPTAYVPRLVRGIHSI